VSNDEIDEAVSALTRSVDRVLTRHTVPTTTPQESSK
jgi:hypothetical protein